MNLEKAVKDAGGYSRVASKIGTTKQTVWSWVNILKRIPAKRVLEFSAAVNIPRSKIRPDIYPPELEAF